MEPRPGFPYIQATSARINFKRGPEKKPYALTNADFSLWQDSENSWGVRLKAQPFRSDLNLNDTGRLQVTGTWQRAGALRDTPLRFAIEWNRAQLGQLTKFFTGNDQGWRGEVLVDLSVAGTPANLQITSDGSIQDFRRYDITSGEALRLAGHCEGQYNSLDHEFHGILCSAPVGTGLITLQGDMGLPGSRSYELILKADNIPASVAAVLALRVKKNIPEDLVAEGGVGGNLHIEQNSAMASKLVFEGRGEFRDLHLASAANKSEIGLETVPFLLTSSEGQPRGLAAQKNSGMKIPDNPHIEFGPFPVALGRGTSTARGWVNRAGYSLSLAGEVDVAKTLRVARMFGLPSLQSATEGTAQVDLQIAGSWAARSNGTTSGFTAPQVTGVARLRNVQIAARGIASPIEIAAAEMQLLPDAVHVGRLNARTGDTIWTGWVEVPRGCGTPVACQAKFNLSANQIALGELSDWMSPKERPWYRVLEASPHSGPSFLTSARAVGQVTTDRLQVQRLTATRVSAKVTLDGGKLQVSDLSADFMGGQHRGQWRADFSGKSSSCEGNGRLNGVLLTSIADAMKDGWIAGTADGSYEVQGPCSPEFWKSAEGMLQFDMRDGSLPHVTLSEDAEPFKVVGFAGQARLQGGEIEMRDAKLESTDGKFLLSGTASLKGDLDLRLARIPSVPVAPGYTITGTVAEPRVNPLSGSETQARLKP